MKNPQIIFLIIIVAVGLVMGGFLLNPSSQGNTKATATPAPQPADPALISNDQAPVIGKSDAKEKIVIFSDYECPYCKSAHEIINDILKNYPDDVSVEYRNFIVHQTSGILAQAAEAANMQGKFKEMSDALFSQTVDASDSGVKDLANKIGLDSTKFANDLNSDNVKNRMTKDDSDAKALNLQGTPSIFLNNVSVDNFNNLTDLVKTQLGK